MSLAQIVATRRFVELADLLSQLPQASRFWSAVMDDDEYAAEVAAQALYRDESDDDLAAEAPSWAPAYRDYTPLYQVTTQVHDAVESLTYTTAKVQGGKPRKPKPYPKPETAIERHKSAAYKSYGNSLLSKLGRSGDSHFGEKVTVNRGEQTLSAEANTEIVEGNGLIKHS